MDEGLRGAISLDAVDYAAVKLVVVGDVILDRSIHGVASRISPEAPVPVVLSSSLQTQLGGAANVAANLAALGVRTSLVGLIGEDEAGSEIEDLARQAEIEAKLLREGIFRTTVKTRVLSHGQQLVRIDEECSPGEWVGGFDQAKLDSALTSALQGADLMIISDYGKGTVHDPQRLIAIASACSVPVVVDPKRPDLAAYQGAMVLTPNAKEFQVALQHAGIAPAGFEQEAEALRRLAGVSALCITRGSEGVSLFRGDEPAMTIPAQAQEVFDVTGAGDTFIAHLSAHLAAGLDVVSAVAVANVAAGLAVAKRGTATVGADELRLACRPGDDELPPILQIAELEGWAKQIRRAHRRIAMTNGCFDLLHPGHVSALRQAKACGDVLLVAVNGDASVRRLKGDSRPILPIADRLRMLQGCRDVDALVVFDDDTPIDIIRRVMPDALVKGDEYRADEVAGADLVVQAGGRLHLIPRADPHSTTALIDRLALAFSANRGGQT